ncbi:MAG: hypothetical protein QNJ31_01950 [Candidatus Caenarcaniphilales bacterium]|nr:hypothetical protein [Candidatus Caenarcaniphilales bacterium]
MIINAASNQQLFNKFVKNQPLTFNSEAKKHSSNIEPQRVTLSATTFTKERLSLILQELKPGEAVLIGRNSKTLDKYLSENKNTYSYIILINHIGISRIHASISAKRHFLKRQIEYSLTNYSSQPLATYISQEKRSTPAEIRQNEVLRQNQTRTLKPGDFIGLDRIVVQFFNPTSETEIIIPQADEETETFINPRNNE